MSFLLHKSSLAFFLWHSPFQKPAVIPFLNPALFGCNCFLDPVVLLPTHKSFPLSLAITRVNAKWWKIFSIATASGFLAGFSVSCAVDCGASSVPVTYLIHGILSPYAVFLSHLSTALNIFPRINTSLCNFHEFKIQNFPKMAFLSGYILRVHPRTHLWHSWVFPHGFMTYGICSKINHISCELCAPLYWWLSASEKYVPSTTNHFVSKTFGVLSHRKCTNLLCSYYEGIQ